MAETRCTPGQTVGPFFGMALPYDGDNALVGPAAPAVVRLHGTVFDGAGDPVPDALLELWQPDGSGRIPRQPGSLRRSASVTGAFTGWGRAGTDAHGRYAFTTLTPGSAGPGRPPFFALTVFARGLLDRLFTRAYLPGEDAAADPLLAGLDADRRATLLCNADAPPAAAGYRFDIRLQGPGETVFLAYRDQPR